jgi:hypothetical protein
LKPYNSIINLSVEAMDFKEVVKNVPTSEGGDYVANSKGERLKGRRLRWKILDFYMKLLLDLYIFLKLNSFYCTFP